MRHGKLAITVMAGLLFGGAGDRAATAAEPAVQVNAQLPTYPQTFDVQGPLANSFGFAVTQPGQIVVDVQSKGAPLNVVLHGPAARPLVQQGSGAIRLSYAVTPQDLQQGVVWGVQVSLTNSAAPAQGGRASGTINIQFPPVDQAVLQRAVQTMTAQIRPPSEQDQNQARAQAASRSQAMFDQQKAQFDRQQSERRATLYAQIRPQLDQLQSRMGSKVQTRGLRGEAAIGATLQPLATTTVQRMPPQTAPSQPATATSSQALQSAGSTPGPQSVAPNPAINSLSVGQGQPGDPVMINGSGFGSVAGEVHFVIAPGKDLIAPAGAIWNSDQIFATVPIEVGVTGFNGTVYVKRATDNIKSNLVPFRFNPTLEPRQIVRIREAQLQQIGSVNAGVQAYNGSMDSVFRIHGNLFWGPHGNDHLYMNTRLKNGWIVSQPPSVFPSSAFDAGTGVAYLVDSHVGTDRPHMNVAFGVGNGHYQVFNYSISMVIQGPKGVPDGVVVP